MIPDGLPPDAAAPDSLRPGRRTWRRDVIEGVTRRIAFATLPALLLALVARTLRREWDLVAVLAVTLVGVLVPLSPRLPPRARVALLVGLLLWANGFLMVYGRDIPFHGLLMPTAASFAALMGGTRWGWWVLAVDERDVAGPWAMQVAGLQPPVDVTWPSQYLRRLVPPCVAHGRARRDDRTRHAPPRGGHGAQRHAARIECGPRRGPCRRWPAGCAKPRRASGGGWRASCTTTSASA